MVKKTLVFMILLMAVSVLVFSGGQSEENGTAEEAEKVTLEITAINPEYEAQEREVWSIFESENPNIEVKILSINEPQQQAFMARIAANDAPHINVDSLPKIDKTTYDTYVNLLDIEYPYWDEFSFDARAIFQQQLGIEDYVPVLQPMGDRKFSFVYYKDAMEAAGVDPMQVKTWEEVDAMLAELKKYSDSIGLDYVVETGWLTGTWMRDMLPILTVSMTGDLEGENAVHLGETKWTDLAANPYVTAFVRLKDWYDKGYLPRRWWTRGWEDMETAFIGKKSYLTMHGPWIWTKVMSANPKAQLGGIPFPPKDGKVYSNGIEARDGIGIYKQWEGTEVFDEVVKAFNWVASPDIIQMRAKYIGAAPSLKKLAPDFSINHPQFREVVKPVLEGLFGEGVTWLNYSYGQAVSGYLKQEGKPFVLQDDSVVQYLGDYFEGKIAIDELMQNFQQKWEYSYGNP